jgi:hypothetical protein
MGEVGPGTRTAVVGAGAIGILAAASAQAVGAPEVALELARAIEGLRAQEAPAALGAGRAAQRAWHAAQAGLVAEWALLAAAAQAMGASAHARAWARARLAEAASRAAGAAGDAALLLPAGDVEKLVAEYAAQIGDVEQRLPGERVGLDPLLARESPQRE